MSDGKPRVFDGDDLPVCLKGDRLEFTVDCLPTIWTNEIKIERWELAGASWDGASIPWWAWSIFGHPLQRRLRWASYWHDRLCESATCVEDRTIADAVFLRLLKQAGVPKVIRIVMWMAVRCYGIFIWRARQ